MSARIQRFERNTKGRDLIVGDIHGNFTKLQAALDAVGFDPARDRLFSVGDLVDRGPESELVLDWLAEPWFRAVQGNHDEMAVSWADGHQDAGNYMANGGAWNIGNPPELRREIAEAMRVLPLGIEIETAHGPVGIVHAECPFDDWEKFRAAIDNPATSRTMIDRIEAIAQWSRTRIDHGDRAEVRGLRALVVGHTPVLQPKVLGNVHYIDTGAWLHPDHGFTAGFTLLDAATLMRAFAPVDEEAA